MNKEVAKVIPECLEKIGKFTPAKHREIRKTLICFLPFSVLGGTIYCIYKERTLKHEEIKLQIEHEETMLQMKYAHEEKLAEIKASFPNREEESEDEKDN